MEVHPPTHAQLKELAEELGFFLSDSDLDSYHTILTPALEAYKALDRLSPPAGSLKYPRTAGYRPGPAENPYNAWYYKTRVRGAANGVLAGKRIVLKDNVMLARVPMMNGTSLLEEFVPELDATVVTRLLDAGGEIVGKAHCEAFCFSTSSHTNATGPVHNPYKRGYSAGGSSSGCAVLVAVGEADMAIGADQAGSIRIPSAFCGVYGLKPTYGLVPYTGILPMEVTLDHAGPITRSVRENALLLEVIAGADGIDPRQQSPSVYPYTLGLEAGVAGLRIGLVREGFGHPNTESEVDHKVRGAAKLFGQLGAIIEEVSIPMHLYGGAIHTPIVVDGVTQVMLDGQGFGTGRMDCYPVSLLEHLRDWRQHAEQLPETIKVTALLASYIRKFFGGAYYGKAMNLASTLTAAYDAVLGAYDLLLMPTVPLKATPLPGPSAGRAEIIGRAFELSTNTAPFNVTHHPAMNIPCGMSDGFPIGMMLIGKHYDESTIYRAAYAFEQAADWMSL
jgi:amidase